jgi:hypothetical protein
MLGRSWVAAPLAASQEGLSYMKLVSYRVQKRFLVNGFLQHTEFLDQLNNNPLKGVPAVWSQSASQSVSQEVS